LPQLHELVILPSNTLEGLIDCAYSILKIRFGDELLILNRANLASLLGKDRDEITALKKHLPPWVLLIGIAGREFLPQQRVEYQLKDITDIAQRNGLTPVRDLPGTRGSSILEKLLSTSSRPYWKLAYKGACQDLFFLTTLDRTPRFTTLVHSAADALAYDSADIGVYLQSLHQGVSCHCECSLPYASDDRGTVSKVKELFVTASKEALKEGAFFSRPYGIWADMMYDKSPANTKLLRNVKGLFDPNHILNSGKLCF
jgi:hypothetical protein